MAKRLTMNLLVAAFVLATMTCSCSGAGIENIRRKLSGLRHGHGASGYSHAQASAAARGAKPAHGYGTYREPAVVSPYYTPTVPAAHGHHYHAAAPAPASASSAASATSAAAAAAAAASASQPRYAAPPAPVYAVPRYNHRQHHNHNHHHQRQYAPAYRYAAPPAPVHHSAPHVSHVPHVPHVRRYSAAPAAGAASSSAAAASGHGGGAAASSAAAAANGASSASSAAAASGGPHGGNSHVAEEEIYNEHFEIPESENTYAAQTGTYTNDGQGRESSSYVRATENVDKHEDGKEDENHYYNAHSYGKTYDENKHEAYNNADEDVLHTPNVFRSKKSSTNYVSDLNKARRESGSGVLAHDKHSASYNKNSRRFKENVDQRFNREGAGVSDSQAFASAEAHEDEDEERVDSDGLGDFVGVDGHVHQRHPGFVRNLGGAAASGSASSDGNGQGVATSSAAAGRNAAASAAGSAGATGHHHHY